ncbi:uncharacterized protein LOC142550786 [Primulina tabacum]|uniref:uncharacterized protein LOC142550786 n=1 Tax=Primulina tabacum TaxID=48773 RepID=UPI003F5AAEF2
MLDSCLCSWISHFQACMRNCIGCCVKSLTIIADESSKGLKIQGQTVNKPVISDDFWSTSTYDLDNGTFPSQKILSSISVSSGIGSSSNSEFVNHGKPIDFTLGSLILRNQSRLLWVGTQKSQHQGKVREAVLSWNTAYEGLLGTSKRFPQSVPLPEMVDFLVDIWDQEGLYD